MLEQARVLKIVLCINAGMFLVEVVAGILARSSSVLADSLDMFGDAAVYASSLYVLGRGRLWQARMAVGKGAVMLAFGGAVVVDVVMKLAGARPPSAERRAPRAWARSESSRSPPIWPASSSSRDIARTTSTCARSGSARGTTSSRTSACSSPQPELRRTGSRWPDIAVGALIAVVFLSSAFKVLREGAREARVARDVARAEAA